ncbi:MAG: GntR family transcriptional regulator [Hyphomonas sp.]|nr:GntR family transcriptional regulator [Hyphomonas sp.]
MKSISEISPQATDLQRDIAEKIFSHAREKGLGKGDPIRESLLAKVLSVSRTPVRTALDVMCEMGLVEHIPRRGYVLAVPADDLPTVEPKPTSRQDDDIYNRLIDLYFEGQLPSEVSEAEMIRRVNVERAPLQRALARLSIEGIIRQRPGYGWRFEPLLRSREADEESYRFRLLIEPSAILLPTFKADVDLLREIRDAQIAMLKRRPSALKSSEVYEANSTFHGALAAFSQNRFVINALEQQNRMRRLVEYRHYLNVERVRAATQDHIDIIDAILDGRLDSAADLMTSHISSALEIMLCRRS